MNTRQDALTQGIVSEFTQDTTNIPEIWYRYADETWNEGYEKKHAIALREYVVLRHTKHTVVLDLKYGGTKRVLKNARRRFAYPTKALAFASYVKRKEWQLRHLEYQLDNAKAVSSAVALVKGLLAR